MNSNIIRDYGKIVNLIVKLIEPYDGTLYDICCGSGGMFVQSIKSIEAHHVNKNKKERTVDMNGVEKRESYL